MVSKVEDVVDEVAWGGDFEVRDGPIIHNKATLLAVELEKVVHATILCILLYVCQGTYDTLEGLFTNIKKLCT